MNIQISVFMRLDIVTMGLKDITKNLHVSLNLIMSIAKRIFHFDRVA